MTRIITRVFPDHAAAKSASDRLQFKGIPSRQCHVIVAGPDAKEKMIEAGVHHTALEPYAARLKAGNAVLVAQTTYKPLEAARITREILAKRETVKVGNINDDFFVPDVPDASPSVLKEHPLFLTFRKSVEGGPITPGLGIPLLKQRKAHRPLSDKRSSRGFWPMPLLSTKARSKSVISGDRRISRMFWPMPLVTKSNRSKSVISR